jgi:hypothetical protein
VTFEAPSFEGSCSVTATSVADARRSASARIEALGTRPRVVSVSIVEGDQSLGVGGDPVQLTVDVVVEGGASEEVAWASSDEDVATVSGGGVVQAVGEGAASITATSVADGSVGDSITVTARFGPFDDGAFLSYSRVPDYNYNRKFVAVDGGLALVPHASSDNPGSVDVYRRLSGGGWVSSATLYPPTDPDRRYRRFGKAVELRGTTAVVMSEYRVTEGDYPTYESRVHIFERRGTGDWVERSLLLAGEGRGVRSVHVALARDVLVLGLPGSSYSTLGMIRVYARDAGGTSAWGLVDEFLSPAAAEDYGALFGSNVDVSEDGALMAVALTPQSDDGHLGRWASVYIFESVGGPDFWQAQDIIPAAELPGDRSSYVAIDGDVLAVTEMPVTIPRSVGLRIFEPLNDGSGDWELIFSRTVDIQRPTETSVIDWATSSIRAVGDTVVLGLAGFECFEPGGGSDVSCGPGEVHVFRRSGGSAGTWSETQVLAPDPAYAYGHQVFGASVDLSSDGSTLAVGSNPVSSYVGGTGGEVFLFER